MRASIERNYRYVELTINRLSSAARRTRRGRGFRIGEKLRNEEEEGGGRSCIGARDNKFLASEKRKKKREKAGLFFKFEQPRNCGNCELIWTRVKPHKEGKFNEGLEGERIFVMMKRFAEKITEKITRLKIILYKALYTRLTINTNFKLGYTFVRVIVNEWPYLANLYFKHFKHREFPHREILVVEPSSRCCIAPDYDAYRGSTAWPAFSPWKIRTNICRMKQRRFKSG